MEKDMEHLINEVRKNRKLRREMRLLKKENDRLQKIVDIIANLTSGDINSGGKNE
jgi:galactokinase